MDNCPCSSLLSDSNANYDLERSRSHASIWKIMKGYCSLQCQVWKYWLSFFFFFFFLLFSFSFFFFFSNIWQEFQGVLFHWLMQSTLAWYLVEVAEYHNSDHFPWQSCSIWVWHKNPLNYLFSLCVTILFTIGQYIRWCDSERRSRSWL